MNTHHRTPLARTLGALLALPLVLCLAARPSSAQQPSYVATRVGTISAVDLPSQTISLALSRNSSIQFSVDSEARITKDTLPAGLVNLRVGDKLIVDLWQVDGELVAYRLESTTLGPKRSAKGILDSRTSLGNEGVGKLVLSGAGKGGAGVLQIAYNPQTLVRRDGAACPIALLEPGDRIDAIAIEGTELGLLAVRLEAHSWQSGYKLTGYTGYVDRVSGNQIGIRQKNGLPAILDATLPGRLRKNYYAALPADLMLGDEISVIGILRPDGVLSILQLAARSPDIPIVPARLEQISPLDGTLLVRLAGGIVKALEVMPGTIVRRGDEVVDYTEIPIGANIRASVLITQNSGPWIATSIQFENPSDDSAREAALGRRP